MEEKIPESKFFAVYMNKVQPKLTIKQNVGTRWLDKSIGFFFAVSLVALLLKFAGEALVEAWLK